MIKDVLVWLESRFFPLPVETKDGDILVPENKWEEFHPQAVVPRKFRNESNEHIELGSVESLIEFVRSLGQSYCPVIYVRHNECACFFNGEEECRVQDIVASTLCVKVRFTEVGSQQVFEFAGFQTFVDTHKENIREYAALSGAIRELKYTDQASVTVKQSGAVTTIATAGRKGLEGGSFQIPREIQVTVPLGTREFMVPVTFILTVVSDGTGFRFTLDHNKQDGSWERLLTEVKAKLTAADLGALILEGA